jgi:Mn-containing catalase
MFFHRQELQFASKPDKPDAVYARKLQEVLGGQYGEITIAMQYMFQGWNMHTPGKAAIWSSASPPRRSATSRCWPR